ncbi:VQ motif-containing protein 10-like [Beta vulgaris subsp. vulgaris]|uniref:VQ motif-containing protein 10-like n=1 Tax=Beta vulgaris subsp. vulgaris TaxID=3555 RepID=UPI002036DA88|nr:VQ motif-containing protein 10-like [Beta vulgaris subsp. vulgaris]
MDNRGKEVEPMKVTLIQTRHVIVEPKQFKTTVQSLTAKNTSLAWIEDPSYASTTKRKPRSTPRSDVLRLESCGGVSDGGNHVVCSSRVVDGIGGHGLSTVDFDEMLHGRLPFMENSENWLWNM